jgi:hypothetical protein
MTDPNGWPDEAISAVGRAFCICGCKCYETRHDWMHGPCEMPRYQAAAALTALAPFLAALVAEARAKALEEAADVAGCDYVTEPDAAGRQFVIRHGDPGIAAAIRALKEVKHG